MASHALYSSAVNIHDIFVNSQISLSIFYAQRKKKIRLKCRVVQTWIYYSMNNEPKKKVTTVRKESINKCS